MTNEELMHYGILGMKWGVRRQKQSSGSSKPSAPKPTDKDAEDGKKRVFSIFKRKEKTKQRTIKDLSNEELQQRIIRMDLERRYKELAQSSVKDNPEGKSFIKDAFKKSAENLLPQVFNHYGSKGLNTLIGETQRVKNEETGQYETILKEVIFANNKKK